MSVTTVDPKIAARLEELERSMEARRKVERNLTAEIARVDAEQTAAVRNLTERLAGGLDGIESRTNARMDALEDRLELVEVWRDACIKDLQERNAKFNELKDLVVSECPADHRTRIEALEARLAIVSDEASELVEHAEASVPALEGFKELEKRLEESEARLKLSCPGCQELKRITDDDQRRRMRAQEDLDRRVRQLEESGDNPTPAEPKTRLEALESRFQAMQETWHPRTEEIVNRLGTLEAAVCNGRSRGDGLSVRLDSLERFDSAKLLARVGGLEKVQSGTLLKAQTVEPVAKRVSWLEDRVKKEYEESVEWADSTNHDLLALKNRGVQESRQMADLEERATEQGKTLDKVWVRLDSITGTAGVHSRGWDHRLSHVEGQVSRLNGMVDRLTADMEDVHPDLNPSGEEDPIRCGTWDGVIKEGTVSPEMREAAGADPPYCHGKRFETDNRVCKICREAGSCRLAMESKQLPPLFEARETCYLVRLKPQVMSLVRPDPSWVLDEFIGLVKVYPMAVVGHESKGRLTLAGSVVAGWKIPPEGSIQGRLVVLGESCAVAGFVTQVIPAIGFEEPSLTLDVREVRRHGDKAH